MNVWKIGSHYGSRGNILETFWKYGVVFAGNNQERMQQVHKGDLIAIADGYTICAVAKVLSEKAENIHRFNFEMQDKTCFDGATGVRVRFHILDPADRFQYEVRQSFVRGHQIHQKVVSLFEKYNHKPFDIDASVYSLNIVKPDSNNNKNGLLTGDTTYVVPVYQRPYSWEREHICKFIKDICNGYTESEPMFIGSMQLSFPVLTNSNQKMAEVIDGQQRLTTMLLFLKTLQCIYPDSILKGASLGWLQTLVNSGEQQLSLSQAMNVGLDANDNFIDITGNIFEEGEIENNRYVKNILLIKDIFNDVISELEVPAETTGKYAFSENDFIRYLSSNVYFVCIKTQAGISKTLKIFNTINTAGLDLGGSDLFKIKFYEYLTEKDNQNSQEVFENISRLYGDIEKHNKDAGTEVTNMSEILTIYKYVILLRSKLSKLTALRTSTDTFFERLFDTISGAADWKAEGFSKANIPDNLLALKDIRKLIEARFRFKDLIQQYPAETMANLTLIRWSRYGRFWILPVIALAFCEDAETQLPSFIKALSRLFITFSCVYGRAIKDINYFVLDCIAEIVAKGNSLEHVVAKINKMISPEAGRGTLSAEFQRSMQNKLAWNPIGKSLLCRLSAMLVCKQDLQAPNKELIEQYFSEPIDIEHIEPVNNEDGSKREEIWSQWNNHLHGIGNLIILERSINRSISNKAHSEKIKGYRNSKYKAVRDIPASWTLEACKEREKDQIELIMRYIYGEEYAKNC